MPNPLRVLDAARRVVDEINELLAHSGARLLYEDDIRDAAESITANIREAYGRREGAERNQFFRYARGSAEETDEHMRPNFRIRRIDATRYWRIHNRLAAIVKMLNSLMNN